MTARAALAVLLMGGLIHVLFFHRLAGRDLWGSHEARAAQNAAGMLETGDWILPRLADDRPDLQKPPLYYWLAAGLGALRGRVDAWAVRLPAALSAALIAAALGGLLWRRGRPVAALSAVLILVTAQHFTWLARTARIDMPLALCVTIAALTAGLTRRRQRLGYAAIGLAVLLKGPIGAALPLAVILADRLLERRLAGTPPDWSGVARGLALSAAIALPWFLLADIRTNGDFFRVFFWYHNVQRAAGGAEALAVHPWWYYGPRLLVDALPASLLLFPVLLLAFRRGLLRGDHEARFGLLWFAVVVGALSFARFKRADYLLPAYPGLALALGCLVERIAAAASARQRRVLASAGAAVILVVLAAWGYLLHVEHPRREPQREHRTFARVVREIVPRPGQVLLFRVECHPLAFHLGRPLNTFLEWENLDVWAGRPGTHYILMAPADAARWRDFVSSGLLLEVCRNTDFSGGAHERPLVLMRTAPNPELAHGSPREQAADRQRGHQHGLAGPGGAGSAGGAGGTRLGERPGPARAPLRGPAD